MNDVLLVAVLHRRHNLYEEETQATVELEICSEIKDVVKEEEEEEEMWSTDRKDKT